MQEWDETFCLDIINVILMKFHATSDRWRLFLSFTLRDPDVHR